ncbi:toprim domain-containing protein [Silvanigrella paludirubra]|uniref:toprim domain-containing protein n=1 Tax=Silvanigrella paludirubra TaxID=2499159 RepID=UPI0013871D81|nr:toprim domain-containing protein [Silvanigrella paludirubra]
MRLRKHSIQNIIQTIPLQDHLRRFMDVKRSGGNAVAKCPFHQDSSPSMYIYQNNYHCFACKAHGTVIDYEMHRTGCSFREAVESLSQTYQIPLEYESSSEEKQNSAKNDFFEAQNKELEKIHLFFKENLNSLIDSNSHSIKLDFKDFLINKLKKYIEFVYTGEQSTCDSFMENISLKEIFKLDLSDRFAFPIYKENGKLGGFAFSNKITQFNNEEPFSENNFLSFLNDLEIFTPFPKSTLHWLNWHQARNQLNNQKNIIVTANFYDLYYLLSLGKLNTIACLQNKIDTSLAKVLAKKVPRITIAVSSLANQNMFLWKTFLETIILSDLSFDTVFFSLQNENISSEDLNKVFLNTKPLWEEIVNKFFDNIPSSIKLGEFQKKLLPIFNKIEDQSRKELILDNIAAKYFGSSKKIFGSANYNKYKLKSSDNNKVNIPPVVQKNEIKIEKKLPQKETLKLDKNFEIEKEYIAKSVYFYHKILLSDLPLAKEARLYLEQRGIELEHIVKWGFGFCPYSNELSRKVEKKLVPSEPLLELGLIKKSKINDGFYDFFHDRIIIPIYGHEGSIIALSGRLFQPHLQSKTKELPKYINSPESAIFAKSNVLYHFYAALQSIVSYGFVLVVEGYMDCISLVNAGVTNTVAVMGTSLTHSHMEALSKVTKRIIICFDSDKAGQNAARRTFFIAFPFKGIDLEYLEIPDGKDPDDFIKKYGVNEFHALIPKTEPLLNRVCKWFFEESNFKPEVFLRQAKEHILPIILQHPDKQVQDESLLFLCDKYFENVYPEDLRQEMEGLSSLHIKPHFVKDVAKPEAFSLEEWPVFSVTEVKLILSLVHSRFYELPIRLRNVAQGLSSSEEANERICALAISNQMSKISFSVYLELLTAMVENQHVSLIELEDLDKFNFSHQTKVVLAYANSNVHILFQYKMEELLKESLPVGVSMISFKNIWDLKNSGFLRFQLRNIKLSSQRGVLSAFTAEALLQLELEYIDNALKAFSSFHFDNEIDKQFHDLVRERTRRSKEFGSFESFNLQ